MLHQSSVYIISPITPTPAVNIYFAINETLELK